MDRIEQWAEVKKEVVELAGEISAIINTEWNRVAEESCAQRPHSHVQIWVADAILEVNHAYVKIWEENYPQDDVKRALTRHWKGRLGDWMVIRAALRGLRSSEAIREMLVARF